MPDTAYPDAVHPQLDIQPGREEPEKRNDPVEDTMPPSSTWHQTVFHTCLVDTTPGWRGRTVRALAASSLLLLVAVQTIALVAIMRAFDPWGSKCDDSSTCATGLYCSKIVMEDAKTTGVCLSCNYPPAFCSTDAIANARTNLTTEDFVRISETAPRNASGAVLVFGTPGLLIYGWLNPDGDPWFSAILDEERVAMCAGCQKSITGYKRAEEQQAARVQDMDWWDWITFLMISIVIALTVWDEIKDAQIAMLRLWRVDAPLLSEQQLYRAALSFVGLARQFLLVPLNLAAAPLFVLHSGGDALNMCLNTVAVLFVLEVDDLAVASGLGRRALALLEATPPLRMRKGDEDLFDLRRTFYQAIMVIAMFTPLLIFRRGFRTDLNGNSIVMEVIYLIWFLAAALEVLVVSLAASTCASSWASQRIKWAHAAVALVLLACVWIVVQSILHALATTLYNTYFLYGRPVDYGNAFVPLSIYRSEASLQDANDPSWIFHLGAFYSKYPGLLYLHMTLNDTLVLG